MVAVQKIREDAFLISWLAANPSYFGGPSGTNFLINGISQSIQLTYKTDLSGDSNSILEMEIDPLPTSPEGRKCSTVFAINSGVEKRMKFQKSIWTTTFSEFCACGQRTNSKRPLYIHLNIFIDFDPTNKIFQDSCGCGRPGLIFNAMVDFSTFLMKTKSNRVNANLLNMWKTKTLADVTFKIQEKEIKAHTLIIASESPVLAAMFQNDFKEKQERIVEINDTKFDVFKKMLRFFYTGEADLDMLEDVGDLLIVANKYGVDSLKVDCAYFVSWRLTVDNVLYYLVLSHLHESPYLHKSALEFIATNAEVIVLRKDWEDLMKNHHQLCLAAVKLIVLSKKNPNQ